jgi:hypothetical protein
VAWWGMHLDRRRAQTVAANFAIPWYNPISKKKNMLAVVQIEMGCVKWS